MRHEPAKQMAVGFSCPMCGSKPEVVAMFPDKGAIALRCTATTTYTPGLAPIACGWNWVEAPDKCVCGRTDRFHLVEVAVEPAPQDDDPNVFEVDADGFYVDPQRGDTYGGLDLAPQPVTGLQCDGCGAFA